MVNYFFDTLTDIFIGLIGADCIFFMSNKIGIVNSFFREAETNGLIKKTIKFHFYGGTGTVTEANFLFGKY